MTRDLKTGEVTTRVRRDLPPGLLDLSPNRPNIQDETAFDEAVGGVISELGDLRRPDMALILPDNCSRLTVLDFDSLTGDAKERLEADSLAVEENRAVRRGNSPDRLPHMAYRERELRRWWLPAQPRSFGNTKPRSSSGDCGRARLALDMRGVEPAAKRPR